MSEQQKCKMHDDVDDDVFSSLLERALKLRVCICMQKY